MQILQAPSDFKYLLEDQNSLKGILWDMDGTVCNTESLHALALKQILNHFHPQNKFTLTELEDLGVGLTDSMVFDKLRERQLFQNINLSEFLKRKSIEYINALNTIERDKIYQEEITDCLNLIKKKQLALGLVTSSEKDPTYATLKFLNIDNFFDLIVTQEDTEQNKPNPAPYLFAMEELGLNPYETLILEDSPTGITAAKASGATFAQVKWY